MFDDQMLKRFLMFFIVQKMGERRSQMIQAGTIPVLALDRR